MRQTLRGYFALALLCISLALCACRGTPALDLPSIMLWAWDRPENLDFIDPRTTGVAFLAGTATIGTDGSTSVRLRTQALKLPSSAAVLPVVRIESPRTHSTARLAALLPSLLRIASLPGARGLQIDYDARRSERDFYRELLASARTLGAGNISVTALASWCEGDRWLERQPIAEAVPMFFRMGRGEWRDAAVRSAVCRESIGLSTDEPWPIWRPATVRRVYLFSPRAWTRDDYESALRRLRLWKAKA